jgi:hypothetical protein
MKKMIIGAAVFTPALGALRGFGPALGAGLRKREAMLDRMPEDFPPSG